MSRVAVIALSGFIVSHCAPLPGIGCAGEWHVRTELYFGMSRPDGSVVSGAEWEMFAAEVLTANFPEGFTIIAGDGGWRGVDGALVREPARIVIRMHQGASGEEKAIADVTAAYRQRFDQQSVLRTDQLTCVVF